MLFCLQGGDMPLGAQTAFVQSAFTIRKTAGVADLSAMIFNA